MSDYVFTISQPTSAGYWRFPGSGTYSTQLHMEKRPRWMTRFLMKWLLEFEWVDK